MTSYPSVKVRDGRVEDRVGGVDIIPDSKGKRWAGGGQGGEGWTSYPSVKVRDGRGGMDIIPGSESARLRTGGGEPGG